MENFLNKLNIVKDYVIKFGNIILIAAVIVLSIILCGKCSSNDKLKEELKRQYNNELAMKDTLSSYVDELGRVNAEKHAYRLTQKELEDSIDYIKKKNSEYISYLKTQIGLKDTVELLCYIDRPYKDSTKLDNGIIKVDSTDVYGKSSRHLSLSIPYDIDTSLNIGGCTFTLEQNIFFEGWLERNKKTGETFVHLRSDYPGISFNSGEGFVAEPSAKYERSMRKTMGVGVFVGPTVGFGYTPQKWQPYVGISLGIGLTYTPRVLQW